MSSGHFITQFGRRIEFVRGYLEFIDRTMGIRRSAEPDHVLSSQNQVGGHGNLDFQAVRERTQGANRTRRLSLHGFGTRLSRFHTFYQMLRDTDIKLPFGRHLDIGCGFGLQPRLIRAFGVAENTTGIDIIERASGIDERHLGRQYRMLKWLRPLENWQERIDAKPAAQRGKYEHLIREKVPGPRLIGKRQGIFLDRDIYRHKVVAPFKLDRIIQGNVFELDEKFDLVTSFTSFEWFDTRDILAKAALLLNEGGILYIWTSNWWTETNVAGLVGHFPFAAQRLTREDYFRYLDQHMPESAEALKATYGFFTPTHPTLADWIEAAYRAGFVPLGHRSYIQPQPFTLKWGVHALAHALHNPPVLAEVLEDIHQFRPDVRLEHLMPYTYKMLFQKVDPARRMNAETLSRATAEVDIHYRPTGVAGRLMKRLARNVLLGGR